LVRVTFTKLMGSCERSKREGLGTIAAVPKVMVRRSETTLWSCPLGIRCVLLPYDETRYQLKLVRELGTIKADLFACYASALAASRRWREEFIPVVGSRP
jgi:hypothetical protein